MKKYVRASVDTWMISRCSVLKSNPVKTGIGYDDDSIIEAIMEMNRDELEKLYLSAVRKANLLGAQGKGEKKYMADRRTRDVEKHIGNTSERDLLDTLVQFVIEGYIVPTKKAASAKRVESSRRIRASKSNDYDAARDALSDVVSQIIYELESQYDVKMPKAGWGLAMEYVLDVLDDPETQKSLGNKINRLSSALYYNNGVFDYDDVVGRIYDDVEDEVISIYENLTGITVA